MILPVEARRWYQKHPIEFCIRHLGAWPDQNQRPILRALANDEDVSIRSGRGVGKTSLLSLATLHYLYCYPYSKVLCIAPTRHQLRDNLWAEIAKWMRHSNISDDFEWTAERLSIKGKESEWFAKAQTAKDPESILGTHSTHLLLVCDEGSGISEDIFDAIDGTLSTKGSRLLMAGNPTKSSGRFYDSHHKLRSLYRTFHISCLDSSRVDKKLIITQKQKWGEDSDMYRCHILGEFPSGDPDTFIRLADVEDAILRDDVSIDGDMCIGVDCARFGSALTSMAFRKGMKVSGIVSWGQCDTQISVGKIKAEVRELRRREEYYGHIKMMIDDVGLGAGIVDPLMHLNTSECPWMENVEIVRVNFGGTGDDDYANIGTKAWGEIRSNLKYMSIPNDDDLIGQLASRKSRMQPTGRTILEAKDEMRRRGLVSPDKADALSLSFCDFCIIPAITIY